MKILICFGTRPEAIKMAPLIHEFSRLDLNFKVCVTGQHREMLDQTLTFFDIIPDFDLNLMKPDQSLNLLGALILSNIDSVFDQFNPELVLVQGDTSTALMVSLAAFHRNIKIAHLEAGLRTYNLNSPFPEEANRQIISRIADLHFVPTKMAYNALIQERVSKKKIFITGNSVIDALLFAKNKLKAGYENEEIKHLKSLIEQDKKLILITGHRRENFEKGIQEVCEAIIQIAKRDDVQIIFPVHLNPKVQKPVLNILGKVPNIKLISPIGYPAFVYLMMESKLIISDSGGIQEEAPSLNKRVLVTRNTTERYEGIDKGFSILTGSSKNVIIKECNLILNDFTEVVKSENPYGDGKTASRVAKIICEVL